jgi:hypothetical protein
MATYNAELGMWRASDGTMHGTQAEAQQAEAAPGGRAGAQSEAEAGGSQADFANRWGKTGYGISDILTPEQIRQSGADVAGARQARTEQTRLAAVPYGTPTTQGGTAAVYGVTPQTGSTVYTPQGAPGAYTQGAAPYQRQLAVSDVVTPGSGPTGAPGTTDIADQTAQDVAADRTNADAQTQGLVARFGDVGYDASQANESRALQNAGASMNQQLFSKLLQYDPEAEAKKQAQRAMQSQVALARSAGGGAGARQAAMFGALEQAPAIQQQAQDQALATQRQNQQEALQAASQYGQIATATRGQDTTQAENQANLGLSVANGIAGVVGHDLDISHSDAQMLANVKIALESANINWAQLSEQERHDKAEEIIQQKGLDQQWKQFQATQKITGKDILGGIFSLGGAAIQAGGGIAAAG